MSRSGPRLSESRSFTHVSLAAAAEAESRCVMNPGTILIQFIIHIVVVVPNPVSQNGKRVTHENHGGTRGSAFCQRTLTPPLCVLGLQEEMTSALATMRVDYEQIKIKTIEDASNPLLKKRRMKANNAMADTQTPAH